MSPRSEIAERIATFVRDNDLAEVFGGDVDKAGRYYEIPFSKARSVDGSVRVYGPKFIQVQYAGSYGRGSEVFDLEKNAIDFLRYAFVKSDRQAADSVPRKGQKPEPNKPSRPRAPPKLAPPPPKKSKLPNVATEGIEAAIDEIDCLVADVKDAKALALMRRVPRSRHYKRPGKGAKTDVPSDGEILEALRRLRAEHYSGSSELGKGFFRQELYFPEEPKRKRAEAKMRRWLLEHNWQEVEHGEFRGRCLEGHCNRWIIDGSHLLWQYNAPCGWQTVKDYPLVSYVELLYHERVAEHGSKTPHLTIGSEKALDVLAMLEGDAWRKEQNAKRLRIDNGFYLSLRAWQILRDMGAVGEGLTLEDLDPTAGLITGASGASYVVFPDGEIVLVAETAAAGKRERARRVMRVVD